MAATVLSVREQKAAISGKKKKKKTIKNILGLPNNVKVKSYVISTQEAEKLKKILERSLPSAKLPFAKHKNDIISESLQQAQVKLLEQAKAKRNQLSLGVNALNRNIKKNIISSALLASDIQPKFLVHHLNLLCNHNNIPLLQVPGLRNITHQTLGFPCICIGFKKNSDFFEAEEEIKSLANYKSIDSKNITESSSESCNSDEESNDELMSSSDKTIEDDIQFNYLYRTSTKERVFVPDLCEKNLKSNDKLESEFISLNNDKSDENFISTERGISTNSVSKQKKKKELLSLRKLDFAEMDDEDFTVMKKKAKKDWLIDKVGNKKFHYSPTNVYKLHSNPNRVKSKSKVTNLIKMKKEDTMK